MSTILKALKRIDQTTPPPDDLQSWPPKIDPQKTVRARIQKILLYRKLYLALILAVGLIATVWLAYSQKDWLASRILPQKTSPKAPVYQAKIDPGSDESKSAVPQKKPGLRRQNARSGAASAPHPAGADQASRRLPRAPASKKSRINKIFASSGKTQPPTANSNTSRLPAADSAKPVKRETRPAPVAAPAKESPTRVERSYRRLDDSKLDLQAIAWSKDARRRIAVINGHIVHEGESVEGFLVNQIRQEDVVVNDGTASWQLELGLK
ncbi:MAG: general secretion pathway protein GspB [Deltaproteobacteria bacterium]